MLLAVVRLRSGLAETGLAETGLAETGLAETGLRWAGRRSVPAGLNGLSGLAGRLGDVRPLPRSRPWLLRRLVGHVLLP